MISINLSLRGPLKFLAAGLLFGAGAVLILRTGLTAPDLAGTPLIVVCYLGALCAILSPVLIWMFFDARARGLAVDEESVPARYTLLLTGIIFTAVGIAGTYGTIRARELEAGEQGIIMLALGTATLIFLVPGLTSLTVFLGLRLGRFTDERIADLESRIGQYLGAGVAGVTVLSLLLFGGFLAVAGRDERETAIGVAMTGITLGVMGLIALVYLIIRRWNAAEGRGSHGRAPGTAVQASASGTIAAGSSAYRWFAALFIFIGLCVLIIGAVMAWHQEPAGGSAVGLFGILWISIVIRNIRAGMRGRAAR